MALSGTALVLRFDFTRVDYGNFPGWGDIQRFTKEYGNLFVHGGVGGLGSYANGAYIIRPQVTVDQLVQAWKEDESSANRQYATYKIFDRKNNRNVETSCAPGSITNYLTRSDLPKEISPAFFRPEVLRNTRLTRKNAPWISAASVAGGRSVLNPTTLMRKDWFTLTSVTCRGCPLKNNCISCHAMCGPRGKLRPVPIRRISWATSTPAMTLCDP